MKFIRLIKARSLGQVVDLQWDGNNDAWIIFDPELELSAGVEYCTEKHMDEIWGEIDKKYINKYLLSVYEYISSNFGDGSGDLLYMKAFNTLDEVKNFLKKKYNLIDIIEK